MTTGTEDEALVSPPLPEPAPAPAPSPAKPTATDRMAKARAAKKPATPTVRQMLPDPVMDETEQSLTRAFSDIIKANRQAKDAIGAQKALDEFTRVFSDLPDEAMHILAENAGFQEIFEKVSRQGGEKPGDMLYDARGRAIGRVPFSYQDFCEIYPMITWTAPRTNPSISCNGVGIAVREGGEYTTPKIFYDIEMDALAQTRIGLNRNVVKEVNSAAADGYSRDVGWRKDTDEELIRKYGVER